MGLAWGGLDQYLSNSGAKTILILGPRSRFSKPIQFSSIILNFPNQQLMRHLGPSILIILSYEIKKVCSLKLNLFLWRKCLVFISFSNKITLPNILTSFILKTKVSVHLYCSGLTEKWVGLVESALVNHPSKEVQGPIHNGIPCLCRKNPLVTFMQNRNQKI